MTYSTTFRQTNVASDAMTAAADLIARAMTRLQYFGSALSLSTAPTVPEATAQLLRMAETYDATQPSYAADLRAAATAANRD